MNLEVSFVITVFNKAKYISRTIDSILRQTKYLDCEYIFVDDASSDNSIDVIKQKFQERRKDYKVRLLYRDSEEIRINQFGIKLEDDKLYCDVFLKEPLELPIKKDGQQGIEENLHSSIKNALINNDKEFVLEGENKYQIINFMLDNGYAPFQQNLVIVSNEQNQGPSISLNKGCAVAQGKYLFLIDGDDILAANALKIMLRALKRRDAEFAFGNCKVTKEGLDKFWNERLKDPNNYMITPTALNNVILGRFVRMAYLTTRELYLKAGGAHEKIFIQDESLPLRLAYHAKKMLVMEGCAVYGEKNEDSLSKNKLQQIHDKFYANYYALLEFDLDSGQRSEIYKTLLSSVWKAKKIKEGFWSSFRFFFTYLGAKLILSNPSEATLTKYKNFIDKLENVRKIP